jgi:hypothetical protein
LGCFWFVELNLKDGDLRPFADFGDNHVLLLDFLLNRKRTKRHVLQVCANAIKAKSSLKIIEIIFQKINIIYSLYLNNPINNSSSSSNNSGTVISNGFVLVNSIPDSSSSLGNNNTITANSSTSVVATATATFDERDVRPIIEQYDMHNLILYPLIEDDKWWNQNSKYTIAIIVEYFRSLNVNFIPIENYLYKLLVDALIKSNRLYQLHQYLQYHVLSDSKTLACMLLSIESTYPVANQLALDMLKRMGNSDEDIIDVMLSKCLVLPAIRYASQVGLADTIMACKFLETAKDASNPLIYFEVYRFFEERNIRLHRTATFKSDENCDIYVKHFNSLFNSKQPSKRLS